MKVEYYSVAELLNPFFAPDKFMHPLTGNLKRLLKSGLLRGLLCAFNFLKGSYPFGCMKAVKMAPLD